MSKETRMQSDLRKAKRELRLLRAQKELERRADREETKARRMFAEGKGQRAPRQGRVKARSAAARENVQASDCAQVVGKFPVFNLADYI